MNRYPTWVYAIVVLALTIGLLYTLPNFFGEVPAVQVAPVKATLKADTALLARVEETLKEAGISHQGVLLDPNGVKLRFPDTDIQYKARDVLQSKLGENYSVALNLLSRSPSWLRSIGALPMYLGLDLRGGVHFLMQ